MKGVQKHAICDCRVCALIWRMLTFIAGAYGLYILLSRGNLKNTLSYFTVQSNLLLAALFAILIFGTAAQIARRGARGEPYHIPEWLQLGIVFVITITFLVFMSLLSMSKFSMGSDIGIANMLLHYAAPIMAIIDWILFMPHGKVGYKSALLWLIYPAAYVAFCFVRAGMGLTFPGGARFPYYFMDADKLGLNLLWICPAFFAAMYVLGLAYVFIDKRIKTR